MSNLSKWIVVSDFDGTLTTKDIGNELCKHFIPEKYETLRLLYKEKKLTLKAYQMQMWADFPCSELAFREFTKKNAKLRPGVLNFLEQCLEQQIPVFIASCGLRPYIEETLCTLVPPSLKKVIQELRCNEAIFDGDRLSHFSTASTNDESPYSLDKGAWCQELKELFAKQQSTVKILGIGNGTSDQSMVGHTDLLAATEGLLEYCQKTGEPVIPFDDFHDLIKTEVFHSPNTL